MCLLIETYQAALRCSPKKTRLPGSAAGQSSRRVSLAASCAQGCAGGGAEALPLLSAGEVHRVGLRWRTAPEGDQCQNKQAFAREWVMGEGPEKKLTPHHVTTAKEK